jgi:hypothetical protein
MSGPEGQESGGALRAQLEATLAREVATRGKLEQVYGLDPGDLKDAEPDQFDARVAEIKAARQAEADKLLTEALRAKGVEDGDLDKLLATLKADKPKEKVESPAARVASLGNIGAPSTTRPGSKGSDGLTGRERILAARERKAQS